MVTILVDRRTFHSGSCHWPAEAHPQTGISNRQSGLVAAGETEVAHDAVDKGDALTVGRPDRIGDLIFRFVDGLQQASGNFQSGKFGDPPIIVTIAESGGDCEALRIGRPVVFIYIGVGGRELAEFAGGEVNESKALLEEGVFDFSGVAGFGDKGASSAVAFSVKRTAIVFSVRGETRRAEKNL